MRQPDTADRTGVANSGSAPVSPDEVVNSRLYVAMVAWMVAGIRTHYENVRPVIASAADVELCPVEVHPWRHEGAIERLPLLPTRLKSTARAFTGTAPLFTLAHPLDVIWTQTLTPLAPFLLTRAAAGHIPVVYDADSTPRLLASFGAQYAEQVAGPSFKRRAVDALHGIVARRCARVVCWSEWAARSFERDYGVVRERISIIPPGVDVTLWAPSATTRPPAQPVRLLFVGGDFTRKGGDLLLDVWRRHLAERCELHLVTHDAVPAQPGVHVYHDFGPNDPALRHLYHTCHALVLPTRGDCFSLASIEAMAAGLPVVATRVGGIAEIIEDGVTGQLIAPNDGAALRAAIALLVDDPDARERMGNAGRAAAAARFDARSNAQRLLNLLRDVA